MEISENCKLYLNNYYVLEQTRNETHRFLEEIAIKFSDIVDDHIRRENREPFIFQKFIQKDGGRVEYYFVMKPPVGELEYLGEDLRFSIVYVDAMRENTLSHPTTCRIIGYTAKNKSKQITETRRMAANLDKSNPYEKCEIELLDKPVDEIINILAKEFINRHDDFIDIMEALIDESTNSYHSG